MENRQTARRAGGFARRIAVLTIAWAALIGNAAGQPTPGVTLLVFNTARVSERTLSEAEKASKQILAEAGVSAEFVNCEVKPTDVTNPDPCQIAGTPATFRLEIDSRKLAGHSLDMLGYSVLPSKEEEVSPSAGVYYPSARALAENSHIELHQILGVVMAHEVGHLLLGANAHSLRGIMCAHWDHEELERAGIGRLVFTRAQAAIMQRAVSKLQATVVGVPTPSHDPDDRERVYRLDTADYHIEMTVRFFPPYEGGRLSFHNSANPGKEVCYSGNGDSSACIERFVGALAAVTYRIQPRRKNVPAAATFREVVKVLAQSEGLDQRPPYIRTQPLVRGVGTDIQAFGYDESAVEEPKRAEVRAESRASMWRVYRQELFLNGDSEPFGVVEWKHTLNRIEVVRATGRGA